jgi:phosphoribosyl-ATP pyrophosphohydrolase/phosphoribosyl-AMP cyclohydrolase/histidinol dehydrogenase
VSPYGLRLTKVRCAPSNRIENIGSFALPTCAGFDTIILDVSDPLLIERLLEIVSTEKNPPFIVIKLPEAHVSLDLISKIHQSSATLLIPSSICALTLAQCTSTPSLLDLSAILSVLLKSDRPDSLYPTCVCDQRGISLGLVYSSIESLRKSIYTGTGVYQSRDRGLWYIFPNFIVGTRELQVEQLKK